jgi:serine phosphatase RsbU (regulator of sigma subunit)
MDDGPPLITPVPDADHAVNINAAQLSALKTFGRALLNVDSAFERLRHLCELMLSKDFRAETAAAVRLRAREPPTVIAGPWTPTGLKAGAGLRVSHGVARAVLETGSPVLGTHDLSCHPADPTTEVRKLSFARNLPVSSVIACPLEERPRGDIDILYVEVPAACGTHEYLSLISLAVEGYKQSNLIWDTRRELQAHAAATRELEMAQQIQRGYIPKAPSVLGLDLALAFEPCKWVGGDYVDAVPMLDGRVLLAIADVCGKGLQAALVASSIHTMVHATLDAGGSAAHLMGRLNAHLCDFLPDHSFVTMACLVVDPRSGKLEFYNAGHLPPILVSAGGVVRYLPSCVNPPLGIRPGPIECHNDVLTEREVLVLYTDGLTEGRSDDQNMLGVEAVGAQVSDWVSCRPVPDSTIIAARISQMLADFRGKQSIIDDTTFLVARRTTAIPGPRLLEA